MLSIKNDTCRLDVHSNTSSLGKKYFQHFTTKECMYYNNVIKTNETFEHKDGKLFIQQLLEHSGELRFDYTYYCDNCIDSYTHKYEEGDKVILEYRLDDGNVVDIAVIRDGNINLIVEICHTHKTLKNRPEPWFEIKTSEINNFKIKMEGPTHSSVMNIKCSRKRPCSRDCLKLNDCQQRALDKILLGKNVFITGGGGVGKSYLIKAIVKVLGQANVTLTGVTGIAAKNVSGSTVHKCFGLKPNESYEQYLNRLTVRDKKKNTRYTYTYN